MALAHQLIHERLSADFSGLRAYFCMTALCMWHLCYCSFHPCVSVQGRNQFPRNSDSGQISGMTQTTKFRKKKKNDLVWAKHLSTKACGVSVAEALDCLESITTRKAVGWYFCLLPGCLGLFCVWIEYGIKYSFGFYFFLVISGGFTIAYILKKKLFFFQVQKVYM